MLKGESCKAQNAQKREKSLTQQRELMHQINWAILSLSPLVQRRKSPNPSKLG